MTIKCNLSLLKQNVYCINGWSVNSKFYPADGDDYTPFYLSQIIPHLGLQFAFLQRPLILFYLRV
jgi:hypothetical protein